MKKILILIGVFTMFNCFANEQKFKNEEINYTTSFSNIYEIVVDYWNTERLNPFPKKEIPLSKITKDNLDIIEEDSFYRLGHSNILMKIDNKYILIDPMFGERASPFSFIGPKRFHETPISIEDLPDIEAVIISHDHYDHLDEESIVKLKEKVNTFIVPLKVGNYLSKWGVNEKKIKELNWWENIELDTSNIVSTPAQHFSGRGVFDRDTTLWSSWVIIGKNSKIYFSGDTGYFSGFKDIGEKYGPFDIAMIETGAYNKLWSDIHMLPEESVQASIDLKAKYMLPIHNSTFDLANHDWDDPLNQSTKLAKEKNVNILTPIIGEQIKIKEPNESKIWWKL